MTEVKTGTGLSRSESGVISEKFISTVCKRLKENKQVRRALPVWGRVHIDRQLPFLVVYRRPSQTEDSETERLVMGEASYLLASGRRKIHDSLSSLVLNIGKTFAEIFGSFLLIEVWAAPGIWANSEEHANGAAFRVVTTKRSKIQTTVERIEEELRRIKTLNRSAEVQVNAQSKMSPPGSSALVSSSQAEQLGWHLMGIEVRPIYWNAQTKETFPLIRRRIHRGLSRAFKKSLFEFVHSKTSHLPPHYHSLGRRKLVKAVWSVDGELAEVSNTFDLLLQVTPTNAESAWTVFKRSRFERVPQFSYRPMPIDPSLVKRRLYEIPIEKIEDPTLSALFRQQQLELDRKLTMINDRGTQRFLYESLQLYGDVDESLMKLAGDILSKVPPRTRDESMSRFLSADAFASRAIEEINYFRVTYPEISTRVELRNDIVGLMVSRGNLLIGERTKIPNSRIEALIQHEVGTHILTYLNGKVQPFRQLCVGLPGYDELQEGLAVLSEYLVGGLTRPRLRLLAARVLAVQRMIDGASLIDLFHELDQEFEFEKRTAFMICMRVFRSGGLTKDASYLRGLVRLLTYLKTGGAIEPLFIGKIATVHVPIIQELQWRHVLGPVPLRPSYLDLPQTLEKLNHLRNGLSVLDLIERS